MFNPPDSFAFDHPNECRAAFPMLSFGDKTKQEDEDVQYDTMASKRQKLQPREGETESGVQTTSTPAGLTDFRILLLGGTYTIPTRTRKRPRCTVRRGKVARRHLTVVDSPGWWYNGRLQDTSEMDKLEMQHSVSLCFPGPHAVFLTVALDRAFTKEQRASVEEHMTILSHTVWSHSIVLFTYGDHLGDRSIEEHIEAEGEDLRWLVDKCGNRYHVLNEDISNPVMLKDNNSKLSLAPFISHRLSSLFSSQFSSLLPMIEMMVAENRGGHYEDDRDVSERKRNIEERAQTLEIKKRNALNAQCEGEHRSTNRSLPAVRMMLVGGEQDQRSEAEHVILEDILPTPLKEFKIQTKLTECVRQRRRVGKRNMTLVNCPDWSTTPPSQTTKDVLLRGVTLCSPGPHAVLVTVDVSFSFSEAARRSVEEHMELLGDGVWRHALVLFTQGDWLGERPVEEYIVSEGEPLRWLVEKCGYMYHVFQSKQSRSYHQDWLMEMMEIIECMVKRNGGYFGTSDSREDGSTRDTGHFKTECYTLSRKPRGTCLIINNEIFTVSWLPPRDGTQKDQEALERVFSRLGFEVKVHSNKTADGIRRVLGDLGRRDFTKADALVVCVLTHGRQGYVLGADGEPVLLRELKQPFISEGAPALAGKPKLFFIQACQGDNIQQVLPPRSSLQEDGVSLGESVAWYADFLMGMAAIEEFTALRDVNTGSFYTQELCRQLEMAAVSGEDIHSVMTAVHREVGKREYQVGCHSYKLIPECRHSLTKKLVLDFI